ncbi:MAG: AbrB/MazE/SpoVT family DNA-binding domain-containing protein, partial [Thermoleophilia bacterium]
MSKITSKGQVTIPKAIRDELGLLPGAEVEFIPGTREAR